VTSVCGSDISRGVSVGVCVVQYWWECSCLFHSAVWFSCIFQFLVKVRYYKLSVSVLY